jgi:putative nucleotidyltransferase with HDIG domain
MSRIRNARRRNGEPQSDPADSRTWLRAALGLLTWVALCVILLGYDLFPGRVSLRVGEVSAALIRAPRTGQYVDLAETERLRREAEESVPQQYAAQPYAVADAEKRVDSMFEALRVVRRGDPAPQPLPRAWSSIPESAMVWLRGISAEELDELHQEARSVVRQVMAREIREQTGDLEAARQEAEALVRERVRRPPAADLLAVIVRAEMAPNRGRDEEGTAVARAEARQAVQEVVRTIDADRVIVFPGERVTRQHLAMLRGLGLAGPGMGYRRLISIAAIVGYIILLLGILTRHRARPVYESPKLLLLVSLLVTVGLFVINLLTLALPHVWVLIVPAAALIAAVLAGDAVGLGVALTLSLLVGLMANTGLPATVLAFGSAVAGLACVSYLWPVSRLRWIVGAMAGTNLVLVAAFGFLQQQTTVSILREAGFAALLYSPGAAALSLGGIVLLQRTFGVTTHVWLLELSNPQHPLLRRMQAEAPGTYYASVMVADLADAAAEAVGADALLARVGALYHDIGKLERPSFFVENQALLGLDNVHDRLSSSLSGMVIMSHARDGVELARRHRLPPEVVSIIEQHHGTTLVGYFYQQALSRERPDSVSEEQFRYPGPLPQSKEAALVMLADSVQAAVKSIAEPTPKRVEQMVREIIRERTMGGQLEECALTFRDIGAVESTMSRILTAALCHKRIEYPEPAGVGQRT